MGYCIDKNILHNMYITELPLMITTIYLFEKFVSI